ncbi:glycosyltransferase family 117 protein [Maribacter halichondriae]|uniref:glycosyltransferase family 117 protein n=1 Tax=Maribacter halichondriae TaxID=2980554 RepID=UPI003076624F
MVSEHFQKWNIGLGWFSFAIAFLVYALTVEPTVSFWDAGEYIATSAKLQVAHPPGAPFLQMIGAFFAMFAIDKTQVALMVNYVSVVSSAFTILFLFWTTTNLVRKLMNTEKPSEAQSLTILGSGLIGALAITFSDSFWFNATETEVYSMASLVMALLLWLGLKWTDNLENPRGNKWLILISFVTGLTFGIQFMGFLAIPSIGLLYYFKKHKTVTVKNFIIANIAVVALLLLIFKFSLTYVLKLFGWSEVFFVNTFGLPFNSGSLIMGLLFASIFYWGLRFTKRKGFRNANTIVVSLLFLVLGFSSWLMLPIRASANIVINEGNPSDARSLLAYYNREQYPAPSSPFYGAYYSDKFADDHPEKNDRPKYEKDHKLGKYVIANNYKDALRGSSPKHVGWLPRMWSEQNAENYMRYYGALEFTIKREFRGNTELQEAVQSLRKQYADGEIDAEEYIRFLTDASDYIEVKPPTLGQNIEYLFHFQLGYMYWRYFMWNFVGRQNDEQGRFNGDGEWLSGISIIDNMRLGSQEYLPTEVLENKARNTYFFLPLLLGLIGLIFQLSKDPKQFWVLLVFFLFTGLAIQFYTNPPIFQPRERDYSLVGSFCIFAIWIGLGVYGLFDEFRKWVKPKLLVPIVVVVCFFAVPGLMAYQNWDDHDRSNRYTALAMAKAYLDSTKKDAGSILFTIGDVDTFPLWYVQGIEGHRTDTRVIVTTYFNTDWYIDQMKRKAYKSEPIPSQLTHNLYKYGSRDVIYHAPMTDTRWPIQDFIKWVASDKPQTKVKSLLEKQGRDISSYSEGYLDVVFYPTNKIRVPVNKKSFGDWIG